jgi:hypothetical protein
MKLSRIEEVDLAYCLFWIVFMGGFLTAILLTMWRIERNTRGKPVVNLTSIGI